MGGGDHNKTIMIIFYHNTQRYTSDATIDVFILKMLF